MSQFFAGLLTLLGSLIFVLAFAWVARSFLDARELTWRRLLLAGFAGTITGLAVAAFLLIDSVEEAADIQVGELTVVALPFQVIATMGAIVVLEALFARSGQMGRSRSLRPMQRVRLASGIVRRAAQVSRIVVRHGLGPLVGLRRGRTGTYSSVELARTARIALEEAGGMFVKLGQLLATRPDLVPPAAQAELGRLHSRAAPVDLDQIEILVEAELGRPMGELFSAFESEPLGSASIAQAHSARLHDGSPVVVKVRRPGILDVVARDLAIARWLARTADRRTDWGRAFDVQGLVEEFAESLESELDFRLEARNLAEVVSAVEDQPLIHVPRVYPELTSSGLLVMERLDGIPLSQLESDLGEHGRRLADALTESQIGAMLAGDRFHGDPHPGNLLILEDGRLGLIDLGISGRLDALERAAVLQILVALRREQPALLYEAMSSLGAVDPAVHDPDQVERAFARFLASYLGPDLPPPEAFIDLLRLTTELGLKMPSSTMAMFRALATLTGTLENLSPGYPVVEAVARVGGSQFARRTLPSSVGDLVRHEWAQLGPLAGRLPRHVDRIATMLEHGRLTTRMRLFTESEDRRFVMTIVNRVVLSLLSVGTGVVSVMLIGLDDEATLGLLGDLGAYELLGWIGLFIAVTLLFRVLLAVLRSERRGPGQLPE